MKGLFITFEGPDGSGKTTQIKRLAEELLKEGLEVVQTREPGGTIISNKIREIILSPDHQEMIDQAEVLLYAASRAQHVHEVIIPALEEGKIVLCDRYIDASVAYQAFGLGMDKKIVENINEFASSALQPNRTYMLNIPVEVSHQRLIHRGNQNQALDRIELKELEYHHKVLNGFLQIATENPLRIVLVDADRSEDSIAQDILTECKTFLNKVQIK